MFGGYDDVERMVIFTTDWITGGGVSREGGCRTC
jgi:hypothetical protein